MRSLAESLAMERDLSVSDAELSDAGKIRRRMLRGEPFMVDEANFPGMTKALVTVTLAQLGKLGYVVDKERLVADGKVRFIYRVTNPEHFPSEEQFLAARAKPKEKPSTEVRSTRGRRPHGGDFECPHGCGGYKSEDSRRKHLRNVHGETVGGLPSKPRAVPAKARSTAPTKTPVLPAAPGVGFAGNAALGMLGLGLNVFLLHLDDEGQVSIGLRGDDGQQLMTKLVGMVGPQ